MTGLNLIIINSLQRSIPVFIITANTHTSIHIICLITDVKIKIDTHLSFSLAKMINSGTVLIITINFQSSKASKENRNAKSALLIQFLPADLWELICSLSAIKNSPKIGEQSGKSLCFLIRSIAKM